MNGPSLAWATAAVAAVHALGVKRLPEDLVEATVGDWTLWINNTREEREVRNVKLQRFDVLAINNRFVGVAIISPSGGIVAGLDEARFIADMNVVIPEKERFE